MHSLCVGILGLGMALLFAGCNLGGDSNASVGSVTVTPRDGNANVGDTVQLLAVAYDEDGDTLRISLAWKSLTPEVGTVSSTGLAIFLNAGDALFVASAGRFSDTVRVHVEDLPTLCGDDKSNHQQVTSGPSAPDPAAGDNDTVFRGLLVDLLNPLIVYLGTERNGIVRSTDGGATWTRLREGMRWNSIGYPEIWSLAQNPDNLAQIFAATTDSPGPLTGDYPSATAGLYRSTNSGATWTRTSCGLPNSKTAFVIFVPGAPNTLVTAVQGGAPSFLNAPEPYYAGGLYRSTDGGDSWHRAVSPVAADSMEFRQILARGNQLITFGLRDNDLAGNVGFLRSTNTGTNWTPFAPDARTKRYYTWTATASGDTLYAAERDGFLIDRSLDAGATWTSIPVDPQQGLVSLLAVSPANPQLGLYATGTGHLLRSTNGFATNSVVLTGTSGFPVQAIQFAPSAPDTVYAVTRGYRVYRSTDAGLTWGLRSHVRLEVLNAVP